MSLHNGSCLCGEVNYKLSSEIKKVVNCHCNLCRSHSGAAFSTYAVLPFAALEISKGEDKLSRFQIVDGKKHFCSVCGTPIFNVNTKYPGACMIYLGTLENAKDISPAVNIWCDSKLSWVDSVSSIPSLAQGVERK
ncbi:MAG: GFA family protein [Gallionellaceae bacterium]